MSRPPVLRRRSSSQHVRRSKRIAAYQGGILEEDETGLKNSLYSKSNSSKISIRPAQFDISDEYLVDYNGDYDPHDPYNWSNVRKWTIVAILSLAGLLGNLGTMICIPAIPQILQYFGSSNRLYETAIISMWEIGEALGPLFIAPLSEIFGRAIVYNIANVWFVIMAIASGASQSPGIVGDMFIQERRGLAMALTAFPPMLGPVIGPIIGGYLSQALGWRWTFWLSAILGAACTIIFAAFYRETYKPAILRARAEQVRKRTGNKAYHSNYDFGTGTTRSREYLKSISRPLQMLVRLPVVTMLAIYMAVQFGLLYVVLATATEVVEEYYNFTEGEAGLSYLGISVGMVLGVATCALTLDPLLRRRQRRHEDSKAVRELTNATLPMFEICADFSARLFQESRFPPTIVGAIGMPIGILIYGWTARTSVPWVVPLLGTSVVGFSFYVASVPLQAYLVDAYTIYAASAIAATVATRCIAGALLPLAAPPLFHTLGLDEGSTIFAVLGIISIPLPIYVMRYGQRIRARDNPKLLE